jgi:hypothetical protein
VSGERPRSGCVQRTIFGTIDIETGQVFHRSYRRERTLEMISFLTVLLMHYGGQGVLGILDHASIHKSRALREWLSEYPQVGLF